MQKSIHRIISLLLIAVYFGVEYFHLFSIDSISPYAIYFFEVVWVLLGWGLLRKIDFIKRNFSALLAIPLVFLLFLGWFVHFFARKQAVVIPFDFSDKETILFLLLIGPLLEEWVFRGTLWRALEVWVNKPVILALTSSLIFSYSHFQAIYGLPEEYKGFVYYQSAYTFILAIVCSFLRVRSGLLLAVMGHVLFNFGFWLGR